MAVAAELPDIDTLWSLRGPISGFQHHRGITHTFLGIPFEAALLVGVLFLVHRWRTRAAAAKGKHVLLRAPVRWGELYGFTLLALLSHILLDYTNNYGIRPFFPFNPRWYAASIVFIFDPLIFLLLLAGLLLPLLFGLIGREISTGRRTVPGSTWARTALALVAVLWIFRAYERANALTIAGTQTLRAPAEHPADDPAPGDSAVAALELRPLLTAQRSLAGPDPFNPFLWYVSTDFGPAYGLATVDTRQKSLTLTRTLTKAKADHLVLAAERSKLGKAYLDWSPMPWIVPTSSDETQSADPTVLLQDVRFMNTSPLLQRHNLPPLTGQVTFDPEGQILAEGIDGRFGH